LGKGREENNVPASHGNEREAELTLPYGYLSCMKKKRIEGKRRRKKKKGNDKKIGRS
jgi:hypothetical protein